MMRASLKIGVVCLLIASHAQAHSYWDWIRKGEYRSDMGTTCCSERDCHRGGVSNLKRSGDGYDFDALIDGVTYRLHAPMGSIHSSIDNESWFCALAQDYLSGKARCLFLPGNA